MRAVWLDVPQSVLDERARTGTDVFDECWNGELHMVPPPSADHQAIGTRLVAALLEQCDASGLLVQYETGIWAADDDWRVPDLVVFPESSRSERGVDGPAHLVVEIRSPNDETDAKLPWYLDHGAGEILVIDPDTRTAQLYRRGAGGQLELAGDTAVGAVTASVGLTLHTWVGDARTELIADVGGRSVSL